MNKMLQVCVNSLMSQVEDLNRQDICIICADHPIEYWSMGICSHSCCWKCSVRLRALFQMKTCPICKTMLPMVLITRKRYSAQQLQSIFQNQESYDCDISMGILFEDQNSRRMIAQALKLACPIQECTSHFTSRLNMPIHMNKAHGLFICDLCFQHKKNFISEIELFPTLDNVYKHRDAPRNGHPQCGFCHTFFYSNEELYDHCRHDHELCHICQSTGKHHQYFKNYQALEKHFNLDHFACKEKECTEKKFVVFLSELDLKAHMIECHGSKRGQRSNQKQSMTIDLLSGRMEIKSSSIPKSVPTNRNQIQTGELYFRDDSYTQTLLESSQFPSLEGTGPSQPLQPSKPAFTSIIKDPTARYSNIKSSNTIDKEDDFPALTTNQQITKHSKKEPKNTSIDDLIQTKKNQKGKIVLFRYGMG